MRLPTLRPAVAGLAVGLGLLLAGCGSDSGTTASDPETPASSATSASPAEPATSAAEGPDCAAVWVEGETLAKSYQGCVSDGVLVAVERIGCSSGQTFVLYDDAYWAVRGGLIKAATDGLAKSEAYLEDMAACRG
jgi:hypothetical protein